MGKGDDSVEKKKLFLGAAALLGIVAVVLFLTLRPQEIGCINHASSHPETNVSSITFSGQPGDRLRLIFSSRIDSGELSLCLYDPSGALVEDFGKARELRTFFTLDQAGVYRLEADYRGFAGWFRARIFAKNGA